MKELILGIIIGTLTSYVATKAITTLNASQEIKVEYEAYAHCVVERDIALYQLNKCNADIEDLNRQLNR